MGLKWDGIGLVMGFLGSPINPSNTALLQSIYEDYKLIKQLGFQLMRPGATDPGFVNAYPFSKIMVQYAAEIGFQKIMWGPTWTGFFGPLTAASYPGYHQQVLDALEWAIANGVTEFAIGNEMESEVDNTTLTFAQMIEEIKNTAIACQAIKAAHNSDIKITYTSTAGSLIVNLWISTGITPGVDLDYICFNPYGANQTDIPGFFTDCKRIWDGFGTLARLSEFNLVIDSQPKTIPPERQEIEISKRIHIIRSLGFEEAYFYVWKKAEGSNPENNSLALSTGGYRDEFWSIFSGRRWFKNV